MADYRAPLDDLTFTLEAVAGLDEVAGWYDTDADTVNAVLSEAGRFVEEVIAPLNRVGDTVGSVHHPDGTVTTPPGFREAYGRYVEAGWGAVPFDPAYGGGGFPWVAGVALQEMLGAANMGFSLCPLLTQGAIDMLSHHGSEEQKARYLPRMITGEWSATMNLTEPQAGSDVGALRATAMPAGDGTYRITGTKIFITYGEHDLTENTVHLVLARVPDAPPGTKGISCFVVPKYLVDDDGGIGERNDVTCVSIEHKMGIHASPTCVLSYGDEGGAVAELIGEENRGMAYMFTMMNNARLSVGVEGVAIGERAYQDAIGYAVERRQGRALGAPAGEPSPIVDHADVRRMLLTMRAYLEAARSLALFDAATIDRSLRHPDADERAAAADLAALLTPVCKAWCTDRGSDMASLGLQVHGGMGYIEETGVAQHYRDIRIAAIYEGTNGIQALDLVARKLPLDGGGVVERLLATIGAEAAEAAASDGALASIGVALADAHAALADTTRWLTEHGLANPLEAFAGATPYLEMFGLVAGGWLLARGATVARGRLDAGAGDAEFLTARVVVARFFAERLLPKVRALAADVQCGAEGLFALSPAALGART